MRYKKKFTQTLMSISSENACKWTQEVIKHDNKLSEGRGRVVVCQC